MEYALGAAIATHNDQRSLARVWELMLVEAADVHAGTDGPVFTAALQQSLRMLTEQISSIDPRATNQRPVDPVRIRSSSAAASCWEPTLIESRFATDRAWSQTA